MGIETAIIVGLLVGGIMTGVSLALMPKSKQNMKHNLNELQVTRAEEGQTIPIVYGTVRVPGSIIWYGNFFTKKIKAAGSKGGG